ncbi:puromycin-sensitive aminopeptidase [Anolis carolinensis]|uniref:Puromycin-sensitive aminopeptidase n=1 Tax=Anolis carolinensis TaxID=28377 RepID=G1KGF3_ANOCA|nr:PREDICTED: puromycin-sensitive aminopeptidase [Anolis carolinensis]|eukprot:XP_003222532.2 PREDICTED: puromycin-sensitive aminopeptidase [Anolis carolinensis]
MAYRCLLAWLSSGLSVSPPASTQALKRVRHPARALHHWEKEAEARETEGRRGRWSAHAQKAEWLSVETGRQRQEEQKGGARARSRQQQASFLAWLGQARCARPSPPSPFPPPPSFFCPRLLSAGGSAPARRASPFASVGAAAAATTASFSFSTTTATQNTSSSASPFPPPSSPASDSSCAAAATMPEKRPFERLPAEVRPINYGLCLKPDLIDFTFEGKLEAAVEVKHATNQIVMNCADIDIITASYAPEGDEEIHATGFNYQNEDEKVTLSFPSTLQKGMGTLKIDFVGELNDKMKGFYRSKYTTPSGDTRFAAVTQFEATDARRAFPCWDEPAIKATFDISLVVPKDRVALSNMNVTDRRPYPDDENLVEVKFARTPVMSTYLVAFVVGEYDFVETRSTDGVLVRVYTPVGKAEQGKFALEVAAKTLPFYKDYFNVPYPLPKIDLIAIADFAAGAMENWGLVTYRETALLIDPKNSCSSSRQWVALVVGHELAHQWFGNLVTMEWWTHLWLNEGFASWIEYLCVDHCFPEYDIWTQFVSADYTRAQELDALDNSHPIEVMVGHPSEVDEIFDAISYSKGASVIRMLHDYIGDEDFRKGMHLYLTKFQHKNAATEDLWASLEHASGKPIAAMMNTWTKQMGFPLVYVEAEQQEDDKVLKLVQKKFCASGPYSGEDYPLWMIPISICTSEDPDHAKMQVLMDKPELMLVLKDAKPEQWVKLNLGTVGFYRTQYSSNMLESLLPAIRDLTLPPVDRLGLQNDLFSLARAGIISTVEVLKVMEAFVNEPNYTVWSDLSCNLGILSTLLSHTDFYEEIQTFVRDIFSPIGEKLGWDPKPGEGHLDALLRGLVLGKLGKAGHKATLEEARRRFKDHVEGKHILSADLRSPVYVTVLKHGDSTTLDTMLKLHKQADMQEEKNRIERVLGAISQPELIQKVLTFALSEEVRPQDTVSVIGGVAGGSKQGRKAAWKFVRDNWEELYNRYQGGFLISRLIKLSVDGFAIDKMAAEVKAFFESHPAPSAERTIQQCCENILLNAAWLKRDAENVHQYFLQRKASPTAV